MQEPLSGWADADAHASIRATASLDARGLAVALWAVGGVAALLVQALVRLTPLALEPLVAGTLTPWQGALYAGWVAAMAWSEGYRGFQLRFVPRVVGRAFHLARSAAPAWHVVLAPAYAMSLVHARRRTRLTAWALLVGIAAVVILVRQVPQPWRGIVDGGVVVGLSWGLVALAVETVRALGGGARPPTDLPPEA